MDEGVLINQCGEQWWDYYKVETDTDRASVDAEAAGGVLQTDPSTTRTKHPSTTNHQPSSPSSSNHQTMQSKIKPTKKQPRHYPNMTMMPVGRPGTSRNNR
ncbi:hypothetical protein TWF718_002520 [Orbilia javanica]|uniref:Uncharacterized protein n=1 Tax=Orbilia javanica TaxID=47235 RepID=A0AAN8RJT8_9PEZI